MLSDDQLGAALRSELHAMGSDIHPRQDVLARVLAKGPAHVRRPPVRGRLPRLEQEPAWPATRRPALAAPRGPAARSTSRRLIGALTLAAVIVALIAVMTAGGGSSILARAYAATSFDGVIVHYVQTLQFQTGAGKPQTAVHDIWAFGQQRHLIVTGNNAKQGTAEITFDGSQVQNYHFPRNTMYTYRVSPRTLARGCGSIGVLLGECGRSDQTNPLTALRSLYHSGLLHATGQATLRGRRVDVIAGSSRGVRLGALVDPHTFTPVEIRLVQQLVRPPGFPPVQLTTTVTDYQRLSLTARNRHLLLMRSHPHARIVHLCVDGSSCSPTHS